MVLCITEPELLPVEVFQCGNRDFLNIFLQHCNIDLDPVTFIYELDPYSLKIYQLCRYELPTSRLLTVIF